MQGPFFGLVYPSNIFLDENGPSCNFTRYKIFDKYMSFIIFMITHGHFLRQMTIEALILQLFSHNIRY